MNCFRSGLDAQREDSSSRLGRWVPSLLSTYIRTVSLLECNANTPSGIGEDALPVDRYTDSR